MKIEAFFILFAFTLAIIFIQSNFVNADIYGYVNITILVSPPSIASIRIMPQEAYIDSVLTCELELRGNNLSDATLSYEWYVNDEFKGNEKQFEGFNVRDKVTCEATVYDSLNRGETKRNSTIIISRNSAITGYIVNNLSTTTSDKGVIMLGLIISLVFLIVKIR